MHHFGALAAGIGAIVYVLLYHWGVGGPAGLLACIADTSAIRMMWLEINITLY